MVLRKWLKEQLKRNILFQSLSDELLSTIVENMYCLEIDANKVIINQGEMGQSMYCIESGSIDVYINHNMDKPISTMKSGDCVGELSLMYDCPRAATCKTQTKCKLWCIDRNTFKITLRREASKEMNKLTDFLTKIPVLQLLSDEERQRIAESLNIVTFKANDIIIREGEQCGDDRCNFYIIKKGKAVAVKKINGKAVNVKDYTENEYFGERALITNEPRAATIKAMSDMELLTLSRGDFLKTMGSVKMVIKDRMKNYEKALDDLSSSSSNKLSPPSKKKAGLMRRIFRRSFTKDADDADDNNQQEMTGRKLKEFKFIHGIGSGSFATVWLVRDKINKQTFALKRMTKKGIEDTQQQEHVENEREILSNVDCEFIIKLYCTFQDELNVYMVLGLGLGGDMFTYLESQGRLNEDKARFFMACVVSAFEYLHIKQIVYRDLKPENLVLDFRGYLKLCDLGFAKRLTSENARTFTVCGTPVYLAPEVIIGKGHSFAVDWWTAGIFLYELMTGYPPFDESNLVQTYDAILKEKPAFKPKYFKSKEIKDLIQGLLTKRQSQRYGHNCKDIKVRIKQHAWFKSIDWEKLRMGEIPSPYRPKLKNDHDTRYFDQDISHRRYENPGKPKDPKAKWMEGF